MVQTARLALRGSVTHYLIVDAQDLDVFKSLESMETQIRVVEDLLPTWISPSGGDERTWVSDRTGVFGGWVLQQLVKLSAFHAFDEDVALYLDSDNLFLRPADLASTFIRDDLLALRRTMGHPVPHEKWLDQAAVVLGLEPSTILRANYVDNYVGWRRHVVDSLLLTVEERTGTEWQDAFLREGLQSEYTLYGVYVDNLLGLEAGKHYVDNRSHALASWGIELQTESDVTAFLERRRNEHLGVMIHSNDDVPIALYSRECQAILDRNLRRERWIRLRDRLRASTIVILDRWPQVRRLRAVLRLTRPSSRG